VLDEDLAVVEDADAFLRHVRFGRDGSELTTRSYAGGIALFLRWCARTGRHWHDGVAALGLFITWLRHAGPQASGVDVVVGGQVLAGPGAEPVREARRINGVLTAVRGFVAHAVTSGQAPGELMGLIYELADERDLPAQARGEEPRMAWRMRARHRLHEPEATVDRASDEEIVALLRACRSARDRLIVVLMARAGLRRGELCGLRRSDVHLLADSRELGCAMPRAGESDFLLVNLFREPIGAPMRPDAINEVIAACSRRAGIEHVTPHRLRHAFGSNLADAGSGLDEIATLMGHASMSSSQVYLHPDPARLREAVDRVRSPRGLAGTDR
jgi:integrase